ncbi:MAG TPA: hypothetical protein PLO65_11765 [Caulobacter sp.]|nr:hypothetical protein [Caulobacter sp.]
MNLVAGLMGELSPQKIEMLRTLVSASPDELVRTLEHAISADGVTGPLAAIGAMVEAEAAERALRFTVLAPVAPLFGSSSDGRPAYPRSALKLLWTALDEEAPDLMRAAADACHYLDPDEASPEVFDQLCELAAEGLATGASDSYAAAAAACDAVRPGGAAEIALCLRMAPIVRPILQRLGDWVQRMTDERKATARLAYRDATALAEGAGPLLFEMLAAHLRQPAMILRVISAVMDHPGERYMAGSELARFGERALGEVEGQLDRLRGMKPGSGVAAGREAGAAVQRALDAVAELEQSVQLSREGPWGQRLTKLKQSLAAAVEARLREIDEAAAHALPVQKLRYSAKLIRTAPKLSDPPDEPAINWAMGLLSFADAVRPCAPDGGFGALRTKVLETLGKRIDQYVEDLLEQLRAGELDDAERAREFLGVAANLLALARDDSSAAIVRRRAAAA